MRTILVTGGAGFIGSNFIKYILTNYPDYIIINVDALTYAGNLINLQSVMNNNRHIFIKADIQNYEQINCIFDRYDISAVINFAAETHVDRSIVNPEQFLMTNIIGTQVLLDAAKKKWKLQLNNKYSKEYRPRVKFLQVSTDEVYGALGTSGKFKEDMPLLPNSPYSASKASADLIVRSYFKTYGLPANITRCSNNYGPNQFPEKLIPLMITNCLRDKELPIYGDGKQVRDWLHVSDHCSAIDVVLHKGLIGEVYNIGGNNEKTNIEIVKLIISDLGRSEGLIRYVEDRPGHDKRYAIDNAKIKKHLGWEPKYSFNEGIKDTIRWYVNNYQWIQDTITGDYYSYYDKMYSTVTKDCT